MHKLHLLDVVGRNHALLVSSLDDTDDPSIVNWLHIADRVILNKTHLIVVCCIVVIQSTVQRTLKQVIIRDYIDKPISRYLSPTTHSCDITGQMAPAISRTSPLTRLRLTAIARRQM